MRHKVKLPKLGDTTKTVLITEWLRSVGDDIEIGTPLLEVETDKITTEVASPVAGRMVEQLVALQDEVSIGESICVIES